MANWYYYNKSGEKVGPISATSLKELAAQGLITKDTKVENHNGRVAVAGQVNGLTFPEATIPFDEGSFRSPAKKEVYGIKTELPKPPIPVALQPESQPVPTAVATPGSFCTYCGQPVHPTTAAACMACGANPKDHRKFCRSCGVPMNEVQVICTKCHTPVAGNTGVGGVPVGQMPAPVAVPTQPQVASMMLITPPLSNEHPFGKVLASGIGKESPSVSGAWIGGLIVGGILAAVFLFLSYALYRNGEAYETSAMFAQRSGNSDKAYREADTADRFVGYGRVALIVGLIIPVIAISGYPVYSS